MSRSTFFFMPLVIVPILYAGQGSVPSGMQKPNVFFPLTANSSGGKVSPSVRARIRSFRLSESDIKKAAASIKKGLSTNAIYGYAVQRILEGKRDSLDGETFFLDFDRDGRGDLLLLPGIFFGPSGGFYVFGRQNGRLVHLHGAATDIEGLRTGSGETTLYLRTTIIDPGECQVVQAVVYRHRTRRAFLGTKLFYASLTDIPRKAMGTPAAMRTVKKTLLRTAPRIYNTPVEKHHYSETTLTLRGNVVAEYPAGARFFRLAKRGGWFFGVFAPDPAPLGSSLSHGMEHSFFDVKRGRVVKDPRPKPWLAGWIRESSIGR